MLELKGSNLLIRCNNEAQTEKARKLINFKNKKS